MARGGRGGRGGRSRGRDASLDDGDTISGRSGRAATGRPARGRAATSSRKSGPSANLSNGEDGDDDGRDAAEGDIELDTLEDDVDRFHRARVGSDAKGSAKGSAKGKGKGKGRVEEEDDDDEEDEDDNDEEVLGLGLSDGDDDDDVEHMSDSDVELEAPKQREISEKAWGRNRQAFYDADIDREDEDGLRAEEDEAQRMQRQRLKDLDASDFGLDALDGPESAAAAGKKKKKSKAGKDTLAALVASAPSAAEAAERITRDVSRLTADEARELVAKDSPELLGLLADLKEKLAELETHLAPLLARVSALEYQGNEGISLLHVKHQLLLSYCTNLCFYFYLKASGIRVSDHPVVAQLVEQRALLEKLRPLETKLKYQIDKLVRAATTGVGAGGKDSVKPNPTRLVGLREDAGGDDTADADEDAKFRPSRLAPMPYDPDAGGRNKAQKTEERLRERASRSRLLRDLQEEFTDAPTEIVEMATERSRVAQKLAEQEAFEEEHFVRLPTTRKDRALKRQRLEMSLEDELDALRDFADLADYTATVRKNEVAAAQDAKARALPSASSGKRAAAAAKSDDHDGDDDGGEEDDIDEDAAAYYNQVKQAKERRHEDRESAVAQKKRARAEEADNDDEDDEGGAVEAGEADATSKRGATAAMLKNKGLTARRKKEQRNPRVRRRMQYEKAKKKLSSTGVRVATTPKTAYGGEATGIKRNVARSVALH